MTSSLPVIVRTPKDPTTDLSAVEDRVGQLKMLNRQQGKTIFMGWLIVLLFFGVLGGWAATMPLSGAVTAMGTLVVEGRNKPIQHYGGGIVAEIMVANGDQVKKGDVLVRLDPTDTEASKEVSQARFMAMLAEEARLTAERDRKQTITFPKELLQAAKTKPEFQLYIDSQTQTFNARRTALEGQVSILKERIDQAQEQIVGIKAQIDSIDRQLELIKDETKSVQYLFDQGLAPKSRLLALQRQDADLAGRKGRLESQIAQAQQSMNETQLRMQNLWDTAYSQAVENLKDIQKDLKELQESRTVASARAERAEVRAPVDGIVKGLAINSVGQVVGSGQELMEIVPLHQPMQVSVHIKPSDIDDITVGQTAEVQLLIYSFRTFSKKIHGTVDFVAADISKPDGILEMRTYPTGYYEATVTLNEEDIDLYRKTDHIELFAGAPVSVIIPTIHRTLLEYLATPLLQGLDSAFREE